MKIIGPLVDMLVKMDKELYQDFVVLEGKSRVLYLQVLKAIYGMLQSALLFYKKLKEDMGKIGFEINPYDPCVANRTVGGKQHTVTWHVDDLKSSHVDPKVNDDFIHWLEVTYGDSEIGKVKAVMGKFHDYLAMSLDYSTPGQVRIDMTDYIAAMIKDFPGLSATSTATTPANENLYKVDPKCKKMGRGQAETLHTIVAKGMFVSKRA